MSVSPLRTPRRRPFLRAAAALLAALAAASAGAAPPELRVPVGEKAFGDIVFDGEEDRVGVDLLAGSKLTFTVKPSAKSPLKCGADLLAPDETVLAVDPRLRKEVKGSVTLKTVAIPATGTWFVAVRGTAAGPLGAYDLVTSAKAPPKLPKVSDTVVAGAPRELSVDALAGSFLTVTVTAARGSALRPHLASLAGPQGEEIDLATGSFKRRETATLSSVTKVPLPSFGTWRVRVTGNDGTGGAFSAAIVVTPPKPSKSARHDLRGASGGEATAGEPSAIEILPASVSVGTGATTPLLAKGTYAGGRTRDLTRAVTWSTRNRNAATVSGGATPGVLTGVAAGGTTVQARLGRTHAREALVLVGGATTAQVDVVPGAASLATGDALRLGALATFAGAAASAETADVTDAVAWQQQGTALASVDGGRAVAGTAIASSTVTATLGAVASPPAAVDVVGRRVLRIAVAPSYAELTGGATSRAFTAMATYTDGTTADVTSSASWASDHHGVATTSGATATRTGAGTAGIRAALDGVTSRPAILNAGPVALSSLTVTGPASVADGATADLAATGVFADGGTRDVTDACTWSSSVPAVVSVSNAAGTRGRVAGEAPNASAATVSASLVVGGAQRLGSTPVTCGAAQSARLRVVPETTTIAAAATAALRVWSTASDGTETEVTSQATWTSGDASVATAAGGVVTGVADGGAVVTATFEGRSARAVVLVGTGRLTGVALSSGAPQAALGETAAFGASAVFTPASGGGSAPIDLAERLLVDAPLSAAPQETGLAARRQATTDARLAFGALVSSAVSFDGTAAAPRGLTAFPQAGFVAFDGTSQLAAQLRASDGSVADAAASATWTSLHPQFVTVGATGLADAVSKGTATLRAEHSGFSSDATVGVLGDPPLVSSVDPGRMLRGASGVTLTIHGTALDGLNPQVTFSGAGFSLVSGPTPNGNGTQATAVVDVSGAAATGTRDVTYTTAVGASTATAALHVVVPAPTIASISPTNVVQGSTNALVTVTGTGFEPGDTFTLESSTGVSLSSVTRVNATTLTGNVTTTGGAPAARLDVTVVQSAANGGATASLTDALKIGPPDPVVASVAPDHVVPGLHGTQAVVVTGSGFTPGIGISFQNVPSNVTLGSATYVSSTKLTFTAAAPASASFGAVDLVLQNSGDVPVTFEDAFAVSPRLPTITGFSARSLARGVTDVPVVVTGTNFRANATLSASGSGLTFSEVTRVDAETITAKASVSGSAATGLRDVTVAHPASEGGVGSTLAGACRVVSASPTVTSVTPAKVGRTGSGGPTRRVPLKVVGTNFSAGATVAVTRSSGSGLTVVGGTTTVVSDTALRFELDVAGTATTGSWDVKVTNPTGGGDSGTTGAAVLEIASETTLAVNRVTPSSGAAHGGDRVTVEGSGFSRGCRVEFGTERALNVQVADRNTLTCTVPPPANPSSASGSSVSTTAPTEVDVKVTNDPSGTPSSATLTKGFAYDADAASSFVIVQSYPAHGATGVPKNLVSGVVRLNAPVNTHTVSFGTNSTNNCLWFESGQFFTANQTGGFGADRRLLVFSRTGGGNLAINGSGKYVLETPVVVKSVAGRALSPVVIDSTTYDQWSFTLSSSTTDTQAPSISSRSPASSATGVGTTVVCSATFSEEIDPLTVTTSSVQLKQGSTVVSCAVAMSDDLRTVRLAPHEELATNTQYTVSLGSAVADLCGNALGATTWSFTTQASDGTAPTIDAVTLADLPPSADGSGTYVDANGNAGNAFDVYLPTYGWTVVVDFSDAGDGVDPTTFSAKVSVASGSASANADIASRFTVTSTSARWTIASSDALTAGDDVTFTFSVADKAGNTSSSKVVTFDVVGKDTTVAAAAGGDHDPIDQREVWVLRFDRDLYTATFSTSSTTQQVTTTGSANGVPDVEEALRINGLTTASMTTDAANCVNGPSVGTNAVVQRLFAERVRATLRQRFGVAADGTRDADAIDVEFLLAGEQGSLASVPAPATSDTSNSANAWSEMEIGGDTAPNSSQTGTYTTIGQAWFDLRNRRREVNLNVGASSTANNGIFTINLFKSSMNAQSGTAWRLRVLDPFQKAKGGTPVGEGSHDDDVLAGTFDRTSASNSTAQNDRYDQIMDAIELSALSVSGVLAHEIGHSLGLVPDGAPKTGFFGNAHESNAFTEATSGSPNTTHHLDFLGNDVMSPASSVDDRIATGTDLIRFSPMDRNGLLSRQVHDEGK